MQVLKFSTIEEATKYVEENCTYESVDEQHTWNSNEVNRVWWKDLKYRLSDEGMKKVAHYNSKQKILAIY